jgi:2-oxo-4-hydroxy-4-carboxy-5-ureidoimidazoline decarboxylase
MTGVDEFNALPEHDARQTLLSCCSAVRWATTVASARPYGSIADLLAASDAAVAELSEPDLREALAGHPRIGDRRIATAPPTGNWSGQEQAGVRGADELVLRELAEGNGAYEGRFGHIYLACATGRSAHELLDFLSQRLGNERQMEWRVVAGELAKINQIRLRKLIGEAA